MSGVEIRLISRVANVGSGIAIGAGLLLRTATDVCPICVVVVVELFGAKSVVDV